MADPPCIRPEYAHPWRLPLAQAAAVQRRLGRHVRLEPLPAGGRDSPGLAAGVDVAYTPEKDYAWAAAVVLDTRFAVVATAVAEGEPDLDYVPGYLAFREGRLTLQALCTLPVTPGVIFLDGHGVVHARGCGLASHVGVLLDRPAVGVAKAPFHAIDHLPGPRRGDYYVLTKEWGAEGAALRLKSGVKPVYVSPGHRVDLESAVRMALAWSTGRRRRPEPLALAHTLSVEARNRGLGRS